MANSLKLYVDPNNANPSRLSRLPNSMRFDSRQELYALNVGAKLWQAKRTQRPRLLLHRMNKLITRIAHRLGFAPIQKRNFAGAAINRLTNDWLSPITSADQEIRSSLSRLRSRCRELERNNDYVRRFLAGL